MGSSRKRKKKTPTSKEETPKRRANEKGQDPQEGCSQGHAGNPITAALQSQWNRIIGCMKQIQNNIMTKAKARTGTADPVKIHPGQHGGTQDFLRPVPTLPEEKGEEQQGKSKEKITSEYYLRSSERSGEDSRNLQRTGYNLRSHQRPRDEIGCDGRNVNERSAEGQGTWPKEKNGQKRRAMKDKGYTLQKDDEHAGPMKKAKVDSPGKKGLDDGKIPKTEEVVQPSKALLPLTVDKFTYHRFLGQGYFGKVMLATDCARKQRVAIKSVKKRVLLCQANGLVERKVLQMAEENIFLVHGYGAFHTQNYIYYVMELVGGGTLHEYLHKVPLPTLGSVKFIGAELVCGLQFIHSKGIIHRDLKTENILLTCNGHVKITDFGLALDDVFGKTLARDVMSTPGLAAPEMIMGHPYSSGVDWFAYGAIMHLVLLGVNPFRGRTRAQVERKVLDHQATYTQCGPVTGDFLARLLCKDQSQRLGENGNIREHLFFSSIHWEELEAGKAESPVTTTQDSMESYTSQRIQVPYGETWKEPIPKVCQRAFHSLPFVCAAWAENYHNAPMHPDALPT